jgi:hypothetical protein
MSISCSCHATRLSSNVLNPSPRGRVRGPVLVLASGHSASCLVFPPPRPVFRQPQRASKEARLMIPGPRAPTAVPAAGKSAVPLLLRQALGGFCFSWLTPG